jgi:hypothetical protein
MCQYCVKADSHIPCRSPAAPRICLSESEPLKATAGSWQGDGMGTAWERHGMCELASAVQRLHVGDLSAFGVFLLPRGVSGNVLSDAVSQCEKKQRLSWTRRSLLFWCKDTRACIIYSTTIMITI